MPAVLEPEQLQDEVETAEYYRPGLTIQRFHQSPARVRFLNGGRGAGKTHACGMESILHAWDNPGAKILCVRKTETSQSDTTIETMRRLFSDMGDLYTDTGTSLFRSWNDGRSVRLPSQKAVEEYNRVAPKMRKGDLLRWLDEEGTKMCGFLEMRGLPSVLIAENKLRGFECSKMWLVEADMIAENEFKMACQCLRWKGYDGDWILGGGVMVETNPPSPRHWIAKLEGEALEGKHPDYDFFHIHTAENKHNLPPGYVENLQHDYRNNPAMYSRMVEGQYAEAFDGDPVFFAFKKEKHVGENLPWVKGAHLVRGWDFGTRNSVVWSAYWNQNGCEYWHDLLEQYLEGSDTERQAREAVKTTAECFPFWNDRTQCEDVMDYCDPSGNNSNFSTEQTKSSIAILNTFGIFPGFKTFDRGLQLTLAIVNRLLEKQDRSGNFCYRIDKVGCPILYRGYCGEYRYARIGDAGYDPNGGNPLKGDACGNVDHIQDAARYSKIGALKLANAGAETKNPNEHKRKNPNPDRMWY